MDRFEESNARIESLGRLRVAGRAVWSAESARGLRRRLKSQTYDLVHVHNFFPLLSPAIHHAATAAGVPVVQTLHNYRLFCLSPTPYREGHVCTDCLGRSVPWPGVVHACYRNDRAASAVVAAMIATHRALRTWWRKVEVFVALSEFSRRRFVEAGLPEARIMVKANAVRADGSAPGRPRGDFVLFAGRLTAAKGVKTLLQAWRILGEPPPLVVAGDGELAGEVAAAQGPTLRWLGKVSPAELSELMASCRLMVIPAESWENGPMVVLEAAARGTPIVASSLGAVGELARRVEGSVTVAPRDARALAEAVVRLYPDVPLLDRLGRAARRAFDAQFGPEANYRRLMEIYARARGRQAETWPGR